MDVYQEALQLHKKNKGKIETISKVSLQTKKDLSLSYTPGVAQPCREIAKNPSKVYDYTIKKNTVAVVSDGSAVLGLGNIGAHAAIPVMEGKAILFKEFAGIDSFPICLDTQDTNEIIQTIKNIAPVFGGINLEDISSPRCFEIEKSLQDIGIPVFHDDQHGTAIVVLAALINSLKVVKKVLPELKVVVSGAGAAGITITKMLGCTGVDEKACAAVKDIILVDSKGIISKKRKDLSAIKTDLVKITNKNNASGSLSDAMQDADVFIGASAPNIVTQKMVQSMNKDAIVLAMANPIPEIMPKLALKAGAKVVGTGRSDFNNQVNNVLAFPGIFKGAFDAKATKITAEMKHVAAHALSSCIKNPTADMILPSPLDKNVVKIVAQEVKRKALEQDISRQ